MACTNVVLHVSTVMWVRKIDIQTTDNILSSQHHAYMQSMHVVQGWQCMYKSIGHVIQPGIERKLYNLLLFSVCMDIKSAEDVES